MKMTEYTYNEYTLENYWSPAQIRLFIDGIWIDDACAVLYQISDNKVPKFGYFDRHFRAVAQGRTVVQGQLSINYRYNGYLRSVIERQVARRRDFDAIMNPGGRWKLKTGQTYEDVFNMDMATRLEWLSAKAADAPPELRQERFDYFKSKLWDRDVVLDGGSDVVTSSSETLVEEMWKRSYQRPGLFTAGFDIMMVAGTESGNYVDPALKRVIQDIHLTGESFRAEIGVPDGGRAIREVYNFFARSVVSAEAKYDTPSTGGAASA